MSKFNFRKRRLAAIITTLLVMFMMSGTMPLNAAEMTDASNPEENMSIEIDDQEVEIDSATDERQPVLSDLQEQPIDTVLDDESISKDGPSAKDGAPQKDEVSEPSESEISVDGNFSPDEVLVGLKPEYSHVNVFDRKKTPIYEIAVEDSLFKNRAADIGIARIQDLTAMHINDSADFDEHFIIDTRDPESVSRYEETHSFHQIFKITLNNSGKQNVIEAIRELEQLDCVFAAEPNYYIPVADSAIGTNDPYYQPALVDINVKGAWDNYSPNVSSVKVAVIDTGISTHNDLNLNLGTGYDFYNENYITTDDSYNHGTHVAGIIGAVGNNGIGISGVAQRVTLIPLQVHDTSNPTYLNSDAIIRAIAHAKAENIPIINASYGARNQNPNPIEMSAYGDYNGLVVCAAGNDGDNNDITPTYPASYPLPNIISVANIYANTNTLYLTSNYGAVTVDIGAPGVSIDSTNSTYINSGMDYVPKTGTSMAAPHVSGVAALLKGNFPHASTEQLKEAILSSAVYTPGLYGLVSTNGRLNAYAAMTYMDNYIANYTITYDANGGTSPPPPQYKTYGKAMTLSSILPAGTGVFLGWSTSPSATVATYQPGGTFTIDANTTLFAVWQTSVNYTVTYDANGGIGAPGSQTKIQGTPLKLNIARPTKAGAIFLGWSTSSSAVSPTYQAGGMFTIDANTTLYAVWNNNVNYYAISGGWHYTEALKSDQTVWVWGRNTDGQLGNGTTTNSSLPIVVPGINSINRISTVPTHRCNMVLKNDGTVWAWGYNGSGQVGNGTTTDQLSPVQILSLGNDNVAVSGGLTHGMALKSNGTVFTWGNNANGQLGDGTTVDSLTPKQVPTLSSVIAISAGANISMALKSDGSVWTWGYNFFGQLGDGTGTTRLSPVHVLDDMAAISAGETSCMALKNDGTVWVWGYNTSGRLGINVISTYTPMQIPNFDNNIAIAAGWLHSMALKSDGTVWTWGSNNDGKLGDGTTIDRPSPVQIPNFGNVNSISLGYVHSIALKNDGTVWTWGENRYGQIGDGTANTQLSPKQVL